MGVGPQNIVQILQAAEAAKDALDTIKKKVPGFVQHFPLGSTAISDVWYNSLTKVLWVKFRKVKEYPKYRFSEVPQELVVEMINARSAGSVYHSKIKGNYHSAEIGGPENDDSIKENIFHLMRE